MKKNQQIIIPVFENIVDKKGVGSVLCLYSNLTMQQDTRY
jgi:hypothetical protein